MNINDILAEIKDRVDDTSVLLADTTKWVNRCQDIIAAEFGKEITAIADIVPKTQEYEWADDFLNVSKVEFLDSSGKFVRILTNSNYRDWQDVTGNPQFYSLRGRNTNIYPCPSETTTGQIKMYGQRRFTDMVAGTDIPELQLNYHDIFVLYGCMRFYEKDLDDMDGVSYYKNEFYSRMQQLRLEYPRRKEPHRTKVAGSWS